MPRGCPLLCWSKFFYNIFCVGAHLEGTTGRLPKTLSCTPWETFEKNKIVEYFDMFCLTRGHRKSCLRDHLIEEVVFREMQTFYFILFSLIRVQCKFSYALHILFSKDYTFRYSEKYTLNFTTACHQRAIFYSLEAVS